MSDFDVRALEEAVILFYSSGSQNQQQAHEWLQAAQVSTQAWSFAWELMQPNKPFQVQFFGATTLHSKLMKSWNEVPKNMHEELKQKLLEAIITFGSGPKLVLDRLCIALSAFIVHMLKEWPTAIEEVVNTFQNQQVSNLSTNVQIWIMMDVLGGIPEEANAIYTSVARASLRHEINKRSSFVIDTINQYASLKCDVVLTEEDMTTLLRAAKCACAWFKNGSITLDNCQYITESFLKLINKCYWHSTESDGCMSAEANELTEACLDALLAMMVQPEANRYSTTALNLMKMFLDSLTNITNSEWKENNLNEDIAVGIYTLLISSIECHSRLLLSGLITENPEHKELYMRLIHEVLQCTDKPGIYPIEESCSILAMGFWYMLQDEILSIEDAESKVKYLGLIRPLYSHLTKILVRKAEQPNESALERWSSDDLESFRCYRQDIADTLLYCFEVLNGEILTILATILTESINIVRTDSTQWPKLESCIYSFCAIAEHIDPIEFKQIPTLMHILTEIPYEKLNTKILGTALETVGAYCEWFNENPSYLPAAIQLLIKGLESPMAPQATLGLKDLTRECQKQLKDYADILLSACHRSLTSVQLRNTESVRLMFSVGKLMSMLPPEKITHYLDTMVSPCFEELQTIAQTRQMTESSKIRTLFRLNMISTLFSSLNTNNVQNIPEGSTSETNLQPVLLVMQKTMPILKEIGEMWINELSIIESLCGALKYAIYNLMSDFKPMLPDLCCLIISIFQNKCCPPAVEIARTCIIMFYKDEHFQSTMQQLLLEVTLYNFQLFEQTPENQFSDIADLIEAFYGFNAQIVKKISSAYTDVNIDCNKLVLYAQKSITLPENGPIKNGVLFLNHFIMQSRSYPIMTTTILEKGEDILRTTLICIGAVTPRTQVDVFADVLLSLNKKYPSEFIVWMKMLQQPNFPTSLVTQNDKESFAKAVIKERVNKRLIQGQIREFACKCRGLVEKI